MDPRLIIIRCVLACLVSAAMLAWEPLAWWVPVFALFMPTALLGNQCTHCDSGTIPTQIQVVLSGFTNNVCADCASYNGTFTLDRIADTAACHWRVELGAPFCAGNKFITLNVDALGIAIGINSTGTTASSFIAWQDAEAAPIDCMFAARSIPHLITIGTQCTHDASAAVITGIP